MVVSRAPHSPRRAERRARWAGWHGGTKPIYADKIIESDRVSRECGRACLLSPGRRSFVATKHIGQVVVPMFGWFKSERRERRKKVRQDRKHLEEKARRFLKSYLDADQTRKPHFYRAVEEISKTCQPADSLSQPDMDDGQIAEATSQAALQMVLDRVRRSADDKVDDFVTDACATVAVAYRRAAGVYVEDEEMKQLGTAAVHLLTMATLYTGAQKE